VTGAPSAAAATDPLLRREPAVGVELDCELVLLARRFLGPEADTVIPVEARQ